MHQPPFTPMMPVLPPGPSWRALRTVSMTLKILAWIVLVLGVIGAFITMAGGSALSNNLGSAMMVSGIATLIGTVIGFIVLYAFAELIMILIMIEHNTRISAFK